VAVSAQTSWCALQHADLSRSACGTRDASFSIRNVHLLSQSYPEFCRCLYDAAPAEFNMAMADWEAAHGKVRFAVT